MMSAILFKSPEGPQLHETKLTCNGFSNAPSRDPNHRIPGWDTRPPLFDSAKFQLNNEGEQGMSNTTKQANKQKFARDGAMSFHTFHFFDPSSLLFGSVGPIRFLSHGVVGESIHETRVFVQVL